MQTKIKNLRITFWGTRGSCPIFPTPWEVQEYARRIGVYSVQGTLVDLKKQIKEGADPLTLLDQLAEDPDAYQLKIGLPNLPVHGGETTCVEVETSEGNVLLFDGGSGIRSCSNNRLAQWKGQQNKKIHFFGSHEHLDHRSGLPFSGLCFARPPIEFDVYGTSYFLKALDERFGFFSHNITEITYRDDPIDYRMMSAKFNGYEVRDYARHPLKPDETPPHWQVVDIRNAVKIGSTEVQPFHAYHGPTSCLGYKVTHNGKSFVFCTDHEMRHARMPDATERSIVLEKKSHEVEMQLFRLLQDVDIAYLDGQYFREEYMGNKGIGCTPAVSRIDWGHGCIEDIIERVERCRIKHAYIGHHDPARDWTELVKISLELAEYSKDKVYKIDTAKDCQVIEI